MFNPQDWRSPFSAELTPLQGLPRFAETDLLACERPDVVRRSSNPHLHELFHQGYTVLPGAVPASVCDRLAALIDPATAVENPHDVWVEYDDPEQGRIYGVPLSQPVVERSQCRYRGMDLYRNQEAAIEACYAPALRELLIAALNSEVLAYQQLAFTYGSQQALHQDPMYVRVSRPLKLIASWIALEDVQPDSGELVVVPASHTLRQLRFNSSDDAQCQHVFAGGEQSLWWNNHDQAAHSARLAQLQQLAGVLGSHVYRPAKGDVLIWSSQLIHGGGPVQLRPDGSRPTRRSLVTHYCPIDSLPMYWYQDPHTRPVSPYPYCHLTWKLLPRFRYPAGFNPNLYRERHQADLRSEAWAWQDPGLHYALFGQREGRATA